MTDLLYHWNHAFRLERTEKQRILEQTTDKNRALQEQQNTRVSYWSESHGGWGVSGVHHSMTRSARIKERSKRLVARKNGRHGMSERTGINCCCGTRENGMRRFQRALLLTSRTIRLCVCACAYGRAAAHGSDKHTRLHTHTKSPTIRLVASLPFVWRHSSCGISLIRSMHRMHLLQALHHVIYLIINYARQRLHPANRTLWTRSNI